MTRHIEFDEARMREDMALSEDLEARAKVVRCSYTGGCNVWYHNKEGFCDYCMYNLDAKEIDDSKPRKTTKGIHHSKRGERIKRKNT